RSVPIAPARSSFESIPPKPSTRPCPRRCAQCTKRRRTERSPWPSSARELHAPNRARPPRSCAPYSASFKSTKSADRSRLPPARLKPLPFLLERAHVDLVSPRAAVLVREVPEGLRDR